MIKISFTESDIKQLRHERFHHPHPRVQINIKAVLLKSQKMKHDKICKITGICGNTLRSYLRDYMEGGIEKLKEINFYRPQSRLEIYKDTPEKYFCENPPSGVKEAMNIIEKLTGIRRSENRVRKFLKHIGMKRIKIGMIPAKADPGGQEKYVKEKLTPRLKEAEEGKRIVFLQMPPILFSVLSRDSCGLSQEFL